MAVRFGLGAVALVFGGMVLVGRALGAEPPAPSTPPPPNAQQLAEGQARQIAAQAAIIDELKHDLAAAIDRKLVCVATLGAASAKPPQGAPVVGLPGGVPQR